MCKGHETQLSVHKHFPFFVTIFTSHFHGDSRIQPACLLPYRPGTSHDLVLINHPMASIVKLGHIVFVLLLPSPRVPGCHLISSTNLVIPHPISCHPDHLHCLQWPPDLTPLLCGRRHNLTHIWASRAGGGLWGACFSQEETLPFDYFIYFSHFSPCLDTCHVFIEHLLWTNHCSRV